MWFRRSLVGYRYQSSFIEVRIASSLNSIFIKSRLIDVDFHFDSNAGIYCPTEGFTVAWFEWTLDRWNWNERLALSSHTFCSPAVLKWGLLFPMELHISKFSSSKFEVEMKFLGIDPRYDRNQISIHVEDMRAPSKITNHVKVTAGGTAPSIRREFFCRITAIGLGFFADSFVTSLVPIVKLKIVVLSSVHQPRNAIPKRLFQFRKLHLGVGCHVVGTQ